MMANDSMYQVSTLQALLLGYSRGVVTVEELLRHGDTGLGTFENVNGEMILLDHRVYRADNDGRVTEVPPEQKVPFTAVAFLEGAEEFTVRAGSSLAELKQQLDLAVDGDFGLNSMYIVRLDGHFPLIRARSEAGQRSDHIELSEILKKNQKDFFFEDVNGSVVALYFPDYMDGINAAGWHFHFVSEDRTQGGHVFDLQFDDLKAKRRRLTDIHIHLPGDKAFDTYSLKTVSRDEVKKVEQQ